MEREGEREQRLLYDENPFVCYSCAGLTRSVAHSPPRILISYSFPSPSYSFCPASLPIPVWRVVRRSLPDARTHAHTTFYLSYFFSSGALALSARRQPPRVGCRRAPTIGREPRPPRYVRRARHAGHTSLLRPARGRAVRTRVFLYIIIIIPSTHTHHPIVVGGMTG